MDTDNQPGATIYWEQRARQFAARGRGLAAVCSYGMPEFYNRFIECCQRRALLPWLSAAAPGRNAALDVGCGVGRWSRELAARGYEVTGVDLSPSMLRQAQAGVGCFAERCSFITADVAALDLGRKFDLIVCVTVLQHLLDPERARSAIHRLAAHLQAGGKLILLEAAPTNPTSRCNSPVFSARTLQWYQEALAGAGLRLVAQRGVDPTPLKIWLLPHYRRLPWIVRMLALALTTAISLPIDWAAGGRLSRYSWHKVLVAQPVAGAGRER